MVRLLCSDLVRQASDWYFSGVRLYKTLDRLTRLYDLLPVVLRILQQLLDVPGPEDGEALGVLGLLLSSSGCSGSVGQLAVLTESRLRLLLHISPLVRIISPIHAFIVAVVVRILAAAAPLTQLVVSGLLASLSWPRRLCLAAWCRQGRLANLHICGD